MKISAELGQLVLEDMLNGITVQDSLKARGIKPFWFLELRNTDPLFDQCYARAQELKSEFMAEEITKIADTEPDAQKARNMIDARKWYASKMQPRKYGDRIDLNVTQTLDLGSWIAEARARVSKVIDSSLPALENLQEISSPQSPLSILDSKLKGG